MSSVEIQDAENEVFEAWGGGYRLNIQPVANDESCVRLVVTSPIGPREGHQSRTTVRAVDLLRDIMLEVPVSQGLMLLEGVEEPLTEFGPADVIVAAPHSGDKYDITTTTLQEAADMAVFWAGIARRCARQDAEAAQRAEEKARKEAEAAKAAHEARVDELAQKLFIAAGRTRNLWSSLATRSRDTYRNMAAAAIDELDPR